MQLNVICIWHIYFEPLRINTRIYLRINKKYPLSHIGRESKKIFYKIPYFFKNSDVFISVTWATVYSLEFSVSCEKNKVSRVYNSKNQVRMR